MWSPNEDGTWKCSIGEPRSHYHVLCSEKGNHAGYGREDSLKLKFYYSDLPEELQAALLSALSRKKPIHVPTGADASSFSIASIDLAK